MKTIRSGRAASFLLMLVSAAVLQATAWGSPEGKIHLNQAEKRTLLLFPVDIGNANLPSSGDVSLLLTDVARARIISSGMYTVIGFNKSTSSVARLHNEQLLTDTEVTAPFAEDNAKAIKIAKMIGYETAFVGSLDDYTYSETDKQANVTISGRIVEAQSGKVLQSATISGSAKGAGKEAEVASEAARSTMEKLMSKLVPVSNAVVEPVPTNNRPPRSPNGPAKKHGKNDWIWGLLAVVVGVGIGVAAGGGHGGSGNELPPPPP